MRRVNTWWGDQISIHAMPTTKDFSQVAGEICEKALRDAKTELHPLMSQADLDRLDKRSEFLQTFQSALEKTIARKIAAWQPAVQSVFRFDESHAVHDPSWDGMIHLLVKVPRLSNALKAMGRSLDKYLLENLKRLGWARFHRQQSILDLQQVTENELRHGVSYGAMFYAVDSIPIQVWPAKR